MTQKTYTHQDLIWMYIKSQRYQLADEISTYYHHLYHCLSKAFHIQLDSLSDNEELNSVFTKLCREYIKIETPTSRALDASLFYKRHDPELSAVEQATGKLATLYKDTILTLFCIAHPEEKTCTHEDLIRCGYDAGKEPDYDRIWENY